ncbi:MAG: hypothetical protein O7G30_07665, partial [Proteobacteria bacterium]|nr:hypothetical protein [Pseudomonadota bacterium]
MVLLVALVVLGTLLLALPGVLAAWILSPDAVDYVGIAHNWLEGRGFVVPILYSYYLPDLSPPAPATAVRSPVLSVLFALPLSLGADLTTLAIAHVVWASLIGAAGLLVARRWMPLPAAFAFAVLLAWSFGWVLMAQQMLTEATSVAMLLLLVALSRRAIDSIPWAVGLAAVAVLAWLTRPNLGLVVAAIALAAAVDLGPRTALRRRPLWVYLGSFVLLQQLTSLAIRASTGVPVYEHYGVMAETLSSEDQWRYQTVYIGWASFLVEHWREVLVDIQDNAIRSYRILFVSTVYHNVGWFALPAVAHGLLAGGAGSFERRFLAFCTLGFVAAGALSYGGYDPLRYPLPAVVCVWLLTAGLLANAGERLAARTAGDAATRKRIAGAVPVVVALLMFAGGAAASVDWAARSWSSFRKHGTIHQGLTGSGQAKDEWSTVARRFCPLIDDDALVAAHDPWTLYLFCGNAGYPLPPDLETLEWVNRYLDDRAPSFIVVDGSDEYTALVRSPRLREIAREGRYVLYELSGSPGR